MSERLLSVGVDVGTTSTQLVVSELQIENRASAFAVPELTISRRDVRYRSPVYFTPLLGQDLVDGPGIRDILAAEYEKAGIHRESVDTGAVIITGETSRKENARAVLAALSEYAGDFVVATAGPELESVLAAQGAGAVAYSGETGKTVLHMDIGGGTSNLALIQNGNIMSTGCLNVGGRLIRLDKTGTVTHLSPVLAGLCSVKLGEQIDRARAQTVVQVLVRALEMAAGLRPRTSLMDALWTKECADRWEPAVGGAVISFSGGVADCIAREYPWLEFGDLGPVLGRAIRDSRLCTGEYRLGEETIRATVIGAGCYSTQLSGSTVFCRNAELPVKNLPVATLSPREQQLCAEDLAAAAKSRLAQLDSEGVLALPGFPAPGYRQVQTLAEGLARAFGTGPVRIAVEQDMAKALGQALSLRLPGDRQILCIDRVRLSKGSFLDIGVPVGPALPVVVKTLVLER